MGRYNGSWIGLAGMLLAAELCLHAPARAAQLADGTTHFLELPRLESASTTFNSVRAWGAVYYFTLTIPAGADEPLQQVVIAQSEGVDRVRFNLARTQAFGDIRRRQPLGVTAQVDGAGAVAVVFEPPIAPGNTVVVGLRPYANPRIGGVYLFGVTAFPAGERPQGRFLGYGRLHFYDNFDRSFFLRRRCTPLGYRC